MWAAIAEELLELLDGSDVYVAVQEGRGRWEEASCYSAEDG